LPLDRAESVCEWMLKGQKSLRDRWELREHNPKL
jgi:hypothetical protein